ncbi:2-phosphosulfolactate phosphatase [Streptomyces griseus]|uniref:2-phosphosulfolactate phosphatase n=1 Tax=Streptomyces griseus TaxID=1911 RepID=UPI00068C59F6|nr:2-phosphosulfolactate phosphatase [Streptomyces griseus]
MRPIFTGTGELTGTPSVAVVVDVMRAFTVAAGAFAQGAERIVLAESLEEGLALKDRHPGWLALQDGPPRPGFDLANSPAQLRSLDVRGRTVVQKTTAGTVGALAVADAELVLCAAFVVAGPTARLLRRRRPAEVTYVITGDGGRAEEDLACARYIAGSALEPGLDPGPFVELARNSSGAARLADGVRLGHQGVHPDDAELCLVVDAHPFAMVAAREDGQVVVRPVRV